MRRSPIRLAVVATAGLLLAGCGDAGEPTADSTTTSDPTDVGETPTEDGTEEATTGDDMDMDETMDETMDMSGAFGEAAEASEADRTIEVAVDNELAFEPAEFEVAAGEVVTFQITNSGDLEHEFVLGDEQAQKQMAEEMAEEMAEGDGHAHSGEMSNAVTIHPGESAELTWRFPDESTTVLVGCHVSGHYEAGMRGSVTVG